MIDKRGAVRYPIVLAAELMIEDSEITLTGRTSDISRTGCYVDSRHPFGAGTKIILKLKHGKATFEVRAKVVYASSGLGMGIAFREPIARKQLELLEKLIAEAALV